MRLAYFLSLVATGVCVVSKAIPGTGTNDFANRDQGVQRQIQSRQMKTEMARQRQRAVIASKRHGTKAGSGGLLGRLVVEQCPA